MLIKTSFGQVGKVFGCILYKKKLKMLSKQLNEKVMKVDLRYNSKTVEK